MPLCNLELSDFKAACSAITIFCVVDFPFIFVFHMFCMHVTMICHWIGGVYFGFICNVPAYETAYHTLTQCSNFNILILLMWNAMELTTFMNINGTLCSSMSSFPSSYSSLVPYNIYKLIHHRYC